MASDEPDFTADLGQATIVYEEPEQEVVETTVSNEHIAYVQGHWILKTGEDDAGHDRIRRIPTQRVFYVERTVEAFESEVQTIADRVESIARGIHTRLPIGGKESTPEESPSEPHRITVSTDHSTHEQDGSTE